MYVFLTGICKRYIFFFQAEDGIRDYKVTGVQTCALPISRVRLRRASLAPLQHARGARRHLRDRARPVHRPDPELGEKSNGTIHREEHAERTGGEQVMAKKIGRASCRERV